jgi:hypothetical protein
MTFPLTVGAGQTGYLANPDQSKYFFWKNQATSAHYYVNNAGVSESEGCTWSKPELGHGNWAPLIELGLLDHIQGRKCAFSMQL